MPVYNVPADTLQAAMQTSLQQGHAVYLSTNLREGLPHRAPEGKGGPREARGILSTKAFNYRTFVTLPRLTAADRRRAGLMPPEEAVAITGYDPDGKGAARKWQARGSWGPRAGDRGYFHLYPDFLAQYGGEVVVPRSAVADELLAAAEARTQAGLQAPRKPAEAWNAEERAGLVFHIISGNTTVKKAASFTGIPEATLTTWVTEGRRALRGALREPRRARGGRS